MYWIKAQILRNAELRVIHIRHSLLNTQNGISDADYSVDTEYYSSLFGYFIYDKHGFVQFINDLFIIWPFKQVVDFLKYFVDHFDFQNS